MPLAEEIPMIKLEIISDPICPWCFIGKTKLDRALEKHPDHPFQIVWQPFQLNPDMPLKGMDRREYLERKFGGQTGAVGVYSQIDRAAREVGLKINFDAIERTPNTLDAHRLIHWAGIEGYQTFMVSNLFRAFFLEGRDIGDTETLCDIAGKVGMDPELVRRLLASDTDRDEIRQRDARYREMGVNSVPTFIVGEQAVVPGAQDSQFWESVIDDFKSALAEE